MLSVCMSHNKEKLSNTRHFWLLVFGPHCSGQTKFQSFLWLPTPHWGCICSQLKQDKHQIENDADKNVVTWNFTTARLHSSQLPHFNYPEQEPPVIFLAITEFCIYDQHAIQRFLWEDIRWLGNRSDMDKEPAQELSSSVLILQFMSTAFHNNGNNIFQYRPSQLTTTGAGYWQHSQGKKLCL